MADEFVIGLGSHGATDCSLTLTKGDRTIEYGVEGAGWQLLDMVAWRRAETLGGDTYPCRIGPTSRMYWVLDALFASDPACWDVLE